MTYYEPRQRVNWKYRQDDGNLLIVSSIDMDIDTEVDMNVTDENSGLVGDKVIDIRLTVNTTGTPEGSPVSKVSEILVESIGTFQSRSYVEEKVVSHSPVQVNASSIKNGIEIATTTIECKDSTDLDYD